ncbi:hypothetical protein [Rhodobaculum claviforme]|uniref:Membrane-associated oxidoreductase n=1 Tax=Rhodobaculum claviforme TaxID=1549854 RepID=A0A934WK42_9RHOB|nr:hypothetical protein [Rhodobaculum claviforme]MBK5928607.1 hypothetical protein [Rhodobaculum claviforme]
MAPRGLSAFDPLTRAEAALVAGLDSGTYDRVGGGGLPEAGDETRQVRADVIRLLLLGGPEVPRLHETGLRLGGAWISGRLDLEGCRIPRDIGLADCRFEFEPVLRSAMIDSLILDGSVLPGLSADRIEARGDIYLRAATVAGAIHLRGARLGGELVLDGAQITEPDGVALNAERLEARGGLLLRGAVVRGGIAVPSVRLGGALNAIGARVERAGAMALDATGLHCASDVNLRRITIEGECEFNGARLRADVDLREARLTAPGLTALSFRRAVIDGALILRDGTTLQGALNLNGASIGTLVDAPGSWPAPGELLLNQCRYDGFLASPIDADSRLAWLARQDPARWDEDFWPQPYEHLASVLSGTGHADDARRVLVAKERLQRAAQRARMRWRALRWLMAVRDFLLGITVGYGRQPFLAFLWLALFWALGAGIFSLVEYHEALRPVPSVMVRAPEWVLCALPAGSETFLASLGQTRAGLATPGQSQLACFLAQPEAASYTRFNAWVFSLDTLIPVFEAGQQDFWLPDSRHPVGFAGRIFVYLLTMAGWALSLLAVAGFSGIVKLK